MSTYFYCNNCNFSCITKSEYSRHVNTKKHGKQEQEMTSTHDVLRCNCGKLYKHESSLSRHKRACEMTNLKTNNNNNNNNNNDYILDVIKDNQDMKQFIMDQQKQMMDILCNRCTTITNNNNIKQKINLNVFLHEQCKDAVNLCDFIKSLKITFDDLQMTRDKSLEDSVSCIMLRGLKELDVYKRPIHCTDQKRDVMYVKEQEKWEKDKGNVKIKNSIEYVSKKQLYVLKELKDSDPEIQTNQNKKDDFLLTMSNICTPIAELGEKRIIKSLAKELIV